MEILSYLSLYQRNTFERYKESILNYIGAFYKEAASNSLKDRVFSLYRDCIQEEFAHLYTPVQANIVHNISSNKCFSFSAPTSTGKSYVFLNLIKESQHDVVIIVPSRALINEFYIKLNSSITDKSVNILTFIDKINTRKANRNIFIVTPERCRELFKYEDFNVELFLFDEAQLSDEESKRGLYFDSIVRRCQRSYPDAKFVFAHPFVANPDSQIKKNHFDEDTSKAFRYEQKNVGQLFMCMDEGRFYHFGVEKDLMGKTKVLYEGDPIETAIHNGKSIFILFYVSKSSILNKSFLNKFEKYINLCVDLNTEDVNIYIDNLKRYTGGNTIENQNYYSQMLSLLKRGIVIHHGSLPLQTRIIIENFTKSGFCHLCFATSTLEQGINMPFDIVFLDKLERSKPLSVKNLIGRAGRSTTDLDFDFGYVIINSSNKMSKFRSIMLQDETLEDVSALETETIHDDDYNAFKDAILNDTFSDDYNLTESELQKLESNEVHDIVKKLLDFVFPNDTLIKINEINNDLKCNLDLYKYFIELYEMYLDRSLIDAERDVLSTAIKIMLWRVYGKTFKNICWYRYSYASKTQERELRERQGRNTNDIFANYFVSYNDIPDKALKRYSLFKNTLAQDVDYDTIVYDTYDYLDKLIGFKLSDIYYAALEKYYLSNRDERALKLAKYIKYGTDNERHIWMLRYGMSYEDIEVLGEHIEDIDETQIIFKPSINNVPEEDRAVINRFI